MSSTVTLNNGVQMPIVGLGTWAYKDSGDREKIYQAVRDAIQVGYRHIDTAAIYEIEDEVGRAVNDAIAAGEVKRDELFIVTKLWINRYRRGEVIPALEESLAKLKLQHVDLYLLHWPMAFTRESTRENMIADNETSIYDETWPEMEKAVELGLAKSIGISNFNSQQVDQLFKVSKIKPVVNQVESHPFLSQRKLLDHCSKYEIKLTAYSPMGGSPVAPEAEKTVPFANFDVRKALFDTELIKQLAQKYGKTAGQILLKFQTQRGIIVIPKSVTKSRIIENLNIFDFELTTQEIEQLEGLNKNLRYVTAKDRVHHVNYPFFIEY